ncbi:uncharacterized protein [Arachis hypogaea]|uniref:uncharacterized protein n=1 Tax=Arachis hypogaea TaxID=3818 RepID=UPI003B21D985
MKTPPNSEDEMESDGDSDEFPIFQGGQRFGELQLQVGMKFNTKQEFREAVKEFTIQEGRGIKFVKNDNIRAANRAWLASRLVKKVRKYPNFKQCETAVYFRSKCDLILHRNSIARALADARNVVYGDEKAQYALLRDYAETLLTTSPGSTVKIGVIPLPDGQVISGCRPLIGLDGAFLKTQIGGQILSAVAQDANHHIYVIAWAIVNVKNKENWKWFLELLHEDLGDYKANGWCFISDMQKGLISAVEDVMPQVHHRFCVWHLWRNFNKQWKDLELRRLLWDAARSTTLQDFIDNMDKINRVSEEAWTYLNKWPMHSWTKSQFSHRPKLDNICNNACEVFNARIKEARSKPIITLLEEVRMFVMRSIAKNKVKLNNHVGKLPPVIQSRLEKVRKESKNWVPIWTGDEEYEKFEVHGHPTNMVVDLGKRLCTCQFWMLTGDIICPYTNFILFFIMNRYTSLIILAAVELIISWFIHYRHSLCSCLCCSCTGEQET